MYEHELNHIFEYLKYSKIIILMGFEYIWFHLSKFETERH